MGFLQISHAVKYQLMGASERVVISIRLLGSIVKHGTFLKTLENFTTYCCLTPLWKMKIISQTHKKYP